MSGAYTVLWSLRAARFFPRRNSSIAINFGPANGYNVFVFGNLNLSNTDAEGRVAVGGTATLSNYGIGAGITPLPPANTDPSFVVGGNLDVSGGSNASGNTVISPTSTVLNYTMGNPNGSLVVGQPIDFSDTERYLKCVSVFWNTLPANGVGGVVFGQLNLTGPAKSSISSSLTAPTCMEPVWR